MSLLTLLSAGLIGGAVHAAPPTATATAPHLLATLQSGSGLGSTVGPDGALYVTEPAVGRISRVDPNTGAVSTFASGLPGQVIPLGGVMDVAFIGDTAYALVTIVGPDVGGTNTVGIYRIDGPDSSTVVADIGQFAMDHRPQGFPIAIATGVQYALENYRGGFLVTDGHHNRVYRVTLDGTVSEMVGYGDVVPTGLEISGDSVLIAEAGPVPHLPQNGKVVSFSPRTSTTTEVAAGAPLLVDVERGRGQTLFALSQGTFQAGNDPGTPAMSDTGSLVLANADGSFTTVATALDRPTSFEIIQNSAYVVNLDGEVWTIGNIAGAPFGK